MAHLHTAVADTGWAGTGLAGVEEERCCAAAELLRALPVQVNIAAGGLQAVKRSAVGKASVGVISS
jgi:hypothetical protein